MSLHGRMMQSFVYERVKSAVDCEAMMQLQAELVCSAMAACADGDDPREVVRRTRRMLRRAWQRYGEEVVLLTREVGDAVLPAPG
jgi:hypothetical protein